VLLLEVVQRSGYRGYGGPNAPFHIVAQQHTIHPGAIPQI
jgi:4-hydroxyphenylpyruvate dioxygenase-like putative hemolysin